MSCGPSYVANTSLSTLNGLKTDENKSRRRKLRFKLMGYTVEGEGRIEGRKDEGEGSIEDKKEDE